MTSVFGVLRLPADVTFGTGTIHSLPLRVAATGRRAVICVDPALAETPAFTEAHRNITAAGVKTALVADVQPELPIAALHRSVDSVRDFGADVVVGYGGGSALDLAKLIALLLTHHGPLPTFYGENQVPGPVLPVIAVPTTAGTGSEVTPVAVLTDPDTELKVGISSPHLIPRAAIVDPDLTLGAPSRVVAYAGADALVHAVEAATAIRPNHNFSAQLPVFVGANDLCLPIALEAARHLVANLPMAVADADDVAPREGLALGSLLAGMAFGSAGTHLSHAIQYPLGAMTGTPHGLGTGMLLPYVLDALLPEATSSLAAVGRALGVVGENEDDLARGAIKRIREVMGAIGIPHTLADIGVEESDLPRVVELACSVSRLVDNTPVDPSPELVDSVVRAAFTGTTKQ